MGDENTEKLMRPYIINVQNITVLMVHAPIHLGLREEKRVQPYLTARLSLHRTLQTYLADGGIKVLL